MIALNAYCCIFQAAWVLEAACVFQWNIKAAALPLLFVYTKVPCRVLQGLFLSMQEFIAKHFKHLLHRFGSHYAFSSSTAFTVPSMQLYQKYPS